ncbi:palmitoyl-protein thioesterase 1-like [Thrips palmi]|uniref:Palmitoyl-protein thioesterase 1 n=1 Tax=Thrips palmi TaxID=161013 RepID=A0A6P8YLD1_THRPL|nr:palmitoyl-protein thioesterase 1-like [Thrips palmi]
MGRSVLFVAALAGLLGLLKGSTAAQVPVVLWHGMGDSCYNDFSMGRIEKLIADRLGEGTYVTSLCFGNNLVEDSASGFIMESNKQVEKACRVIAEDENLKDGYHAVGLSQGGQFLRAVAQRCPSPPMKVLVSLGGQHQGVYGLPHCQSGIICNAVRKLLSVGAYWPLVQDILVQAQYWHDAHSPQRYRRGSTFLADINNDVQHASDRNSSYAENLTKLDKLVLVRFNNDSMVVPRASSWFEFYAPGSTSEILPLEESAIYKEDWIGLKQLAETGRLVRLAVNGDHLRFSNSWFLSEIVDKYLRTVD